MELSASFLAIAIPAVMISGISKGGVASGAGFLGTMLLALAVPPAQAIGVMLPMLMLMDVTSLRSYWRRWSWPHARQLMIGMVPGVIAGTLLFRSVDPDTIRLLVGVMAIGFVVFQVARGRGWLRGGTAFGTPGWGLVWGAVSGFTSFVSHSGGPPAAMYLLGTRLEKTTYQATTVIAFWWVNLIKFPPYMALGMFTFDSAKANLVLAPFAVLGVLIGARAHKILPEALFFRVTYVLLVLTGSKLIWDALS